MDILDAIAAALNALPLDILALLFALAIDLALGEPPNEQHPTAWMGKTIGAVERMAPGPRAAKWAQFVFGLGMALLLPGAWGALAWGLSYGTLAAHPLLYLILVARFLKTTFAVRMLHQVARGVRRALAAGDIEAARERLAALVSRDTSQLTAGQMAAAAIESVAENITDSIVGPLLAFALFGLTGAIVYRVINTLDSMIGYRGRYEYLGKAAARLDDVVNIVPARVAALLLGVTAFVLPGMSAGRAGRIMLAHRGRTESPNAGWTMAAMAGGLGVTLEKVGHYRLGDPAPEPGPADIGRATRALYATTGLALAVVIVIIWLRWVWL